MSEPEIKKFLFDRSFDTPGKNERREEKEEKEPEEEEGQDNGAELEDIPEIPTFSEEDLAAAREEGFGRGFEDGSRNASAATERRTAESLEAISDRMGRLMDERGSDLNAAVQSGVSVAAAIVRKLFPAMTRREAGNEIEAMVAETLRRVLDEPRLTIRIDPECHPLVEEKIGRLAERLGFEGKLTLLADPDMAEGDCSIEWADGGAERDGNAIWRQIDAIVESHLEKSGDAGMDMTAPDAHNAEEEPVDGKQ